MLVGDKLTFVLFFAGTAITFVLTAVSVAGWRHRVIIFVLFALAAICLSIGIAWPFVDTNTFVPALASDIQKIAENPVSWFVVLILGVFSSHIKLWQNNSTIKPDVGHSRESKPPSVVEKDLAVRGKAVPRCVGRIVSWASKRCPLTRLVGMLFSMNNIDMGSSGIFGFFAMAAIQNGINSKFNSAQNIAKSPA